VRATRLLERGGGPLHAGVRRLGELERRIAENLTADLRVERLAERVGMSPSNLARRYTETRKRTCASPILRPSVNNHPDVPTADQTKTSRRSMTFEPIAIGDPHEFQTVNGCNWRGCDKNESTGTTPAARLQASIPRRGAAGGPSRACALAKLVLCENSADAGSRDNRRIRGSRRRLVAPELGPT
jgi:hypothetical protein